MKAKRCRVCGQIKETPYKDICRSCYMRELRYRKKMEQRRKERIKILVLAWIGFLAGIIVLAILSSI